TRGHTGQRNQALARMLRLPPARRCRRAGSIMSSSCLRSYRSDVRQAVRPHGAVGFLIPGSHASSSARKPTGLDLRPNGSGRCCIHVQYERSLRRQFGFFLPQLTHSSPVSFSAPQPLYATLRSPACRLETLPMKKHELSIAQQIALSLVTLLLLSVGVTVGGYMAGAQDREKIAGFASDAATATGVITRKYIHSVGPGRV